MNQHIIIWQGADAQTATFAKGLSTNQEHRAWVLCASSQKPLFDAVGVQAHEMPASQADASAWKDALHAAYIAAATSAAAAAAVDVMPLSVVLSAEHCENAHDMLRAIRKGMGQVVGARFTLHIVMAADHQSSHAAAQQDFLKALQADVQGKEQDELDSREKEIELESELKELIKIKSDELSQNGAKPLSDAESRQIYADAAAQKAEKYRAFMNEQQEKATWLEWECLSVLSDCNNNGSFAPEIKETRGDLLAGLVLTAPVAASDRFKCRAYTVQQTSFTRNQVQDLPRYLLYQRISAHREDVQAARSAFLPDLTSLREQFAKALSGQRQTLVYALLADDENYPERYAQELWQQFQQSNPTLPTSQLVTDKTEAWLQKAKKQLACWVDVDAEVKDYIQPDGVLEAEIRKLQKELDEQKPMPRIGDARFGKKRSLKKRMHDADTLAAALQSELAWMYTRDCLAQIVGCLPELNEYLQGMQQANDRIFEGYTTEITEVLENTAWANAVSNALKNFQLEKIAPTELTLTDYQAWLEGCLQESYFQFIPSALGDISTEDFVANATASAEKDAHGYQMIAKPFYASANSFEPLVFLGGSTRLYRLSPMNWKIGDVDTDCLFTELPPGGAHTDGSDAAVSTAAAAHKTVDMQATFQLKGAEYELTWYWANRATEMDITITDDAGAICAEGHKVDDGYEPKATWSVSAQKLPQEAQITIHLLDNLKQSCTLKHTLPRLSCDVIGDPVHRTFLDRFKSSPMACYEIDIPLSPLEGLSADRFMLELSDGVQAYHYPIADTDGKMRLLCAPDGEWLAKLVLKGDSDHGIL